MRVVVCNLDDGNLGIQRSAFSENSRDMPSLPQRQRNSVSASAC